MTNIDIVDLPKEFARTFGNSTKEKLITEAINEIEELRKSLIFHIEESEERNKSRLHWLDMYHAAQELFNEEMEARNDCYHTVCEWCARSRLEEHVEDGEIYASYVCSDWRYFIDGDECFRFNRKKYYSEIKKILKEENRKNDR